MTTQKTSGHRHPSPLAALVIVPVVVAIVLTLFAWPTAKLEPRDLPVGVAGPPAAVGQLEQQLGANPDAFDVHRYSTEAEARAAIEDREVYGAFVATPEGPKVLSSSAASPAVAQLLGHAAAETGAPTEDVVAAEHGAALPSSVLPLVIAGLLTGIAAALLTTSALARAGLLLGVSALVGLVAAAIVQSWLDVVEGHWIVNAGVLGLTVLAIGATVAGLYAWLGGAGIGVAAALMVFIGNPFSGAGSAPELLPEPVGGIGQLLPPGAGANLLRSTGFFDGAAAGARGPHAGGRPPRLRLISRRFLRPRRSRGAARSRACSCAAPGPRSAAGA
jgi:hypothetical protein